jgi:hypothetical protein
VMKLWIVFAANRATMIIFIQDPIAKGLWDANSYFHNRVGEGEAHND